MNSARVYKRHSVISKNECVHIPADDIKQNLPYFTEEPAEAVSERTRIAKSDSAGTADEVLTHAEKCSNGAFSEKTAQDGGVVKQNDRKSAEPNAFAAVRAPDKDALSVMYKKEIEALAQAQAEKAYFDALTKKKHELQQCIEDVSRFCM